MPSQNSLAARYSQRYPTSRRASDRLRAVIAGGATHDSWGVQPFAILTERAKGPVKWTIDGEQVIDYWMGHGSLLCGHSFQPVVDAVRDQANVGFQYGGSHLLQVQWAELITEIVPGADAVRFTSSGTEATLLAFRVARALTGRKILVKLDGHFHGWHDDALGHFLPSEASGFDSSCTEEVRVAAPNIDAVMEAIDCNVAGVILEPGGGGSGALAWSVDFLRQLRSVTQQNGTVLIFDETVSGFRYAPGGVQSVSGVIPDLTVLGKILTGGLPGGALAGRKDVMQVFGNGITIGGRPIKVPHTGTFNANALSAAAGIAMLEHVRDGSHQELAHEAARHLCLLVNDEASSQEVDVYLFQQGGIFHTLIGAAERDLPLGPSESALLLPKAFPVAYHSLRLALLIYGVDSHPVHGWLSSAHTPEVIRETARAFGSAFRCLKAEDLLPRRDRALKA